MSLKGLTLPLVLFAFAVWAVFLAGIASLQSSCNDGSRPVGDPSDVPAAGLNTAGLTGVWGFSSNVLVCSQLFRFYWFIAAWQFVVLLAALITSFIGHVPLAATRAFWVGMFTISSLLFMIASEAFLAGISARVYGAGDYHLLARIRTAAAGAIMSVVASVFLILAIGTDWDRSSGVYHKHDRSAMTGAPTGPTVV